MLKYAGGAGRRIFSNSLFCATAIGLASLAAASAKAQDVQTTDTDAAATPADEAPLDPDNVIIVTAQLRAQSLQDVPLSITAINGAGLRGRSRV